ncbi:flippase-like domain-containing protein, partial [Desulfobulbus sp. AH-315-M07]|nr:flippase-like domain-containing protein [Desulfobulbus sp. AH-315-M07]
AGAGMAVGSMPDQLEVQLVAGGAIALFPCYLLVIAARPRFLSKHSLLQPLFDARVGGTVRIVLSHGVHLGVMVVGHFVVMRLFGIAVPLSTAITRLPVMFLITALPIAPSGLGTTQAAAIALFADFAPGGSEDTRIATVFAYSLSFHVISVIGMALVGFASWRKLAASIRGD